MRRPLPLFSPVPEAMRSSQLCVKRRQVDETGCRRLFRLQMSWIDSRKQLDSRLQDSPLEGDRPSPLERVLPWEMACTLRAQRSGKAALLVENDFQFHLDRCAAPKP